MGGQGPIWTIEPLDEWMDGYGQLFEFGIFFVWRKRFLSFIVCVMWQKFYIFIQ
jgi:hypothetical protein